MIEVIAIVAVMAAVGLAIWVSWLLIDLRFLRDIKKINEEYIKAIEEQNRYLLYDMLPRFIKDYQNLKEVENEQTK